MFKIGDKVRMIRPYSPTDFEGLTATVSCIDGNYIYGDTFKGNRHYSRFVLVERELKGFAKFLKLQEEMSNA